MKAVVNILLFLLIVMHTTKSIVTFVSFKWNQEYIAETYCENKQRPKLACDGKCYLKKQIEQQQKSEENPLLPKKGQYIFDFFLTEEKQWFDFSISEQFIHLVESAKTIFVLNTTLYSSLWVHEILRPPTVF